MKTKKKKILHRVEKKEKDFQFIIETKRNYKRRILACCKDFTSVRKSSENTAPAEISNSTQLHLRRFTLDPLT